MILTLLLFLRMLPACPTDGWITSDYGWRRDPFTGGSSYHKGLDIAAPKGTPIRAMWAGKVVYARWGSSYGWLVTIDHPHGWQTKYAHASKLFVEKGDYVETGEVVGQIGSTGRSTGNHLHLEMYYKEKRKDPKQWMLCKEN